MKIGLMIFVSASIIIIAFTSCSSNGNTGNGANDPISQFETDKVKHIEGSEDNINDTTQSTVPASNDTTTQEKYH